MTDLIENRVPDGHEVLDLVAGDAIPPASVDVDVNPALVDDPPRLGRVLLRRVRDRGALLAVGDRAGDGAGDDRRIGEGHTGTTPPRFHGRAIRLPAAISSPRQIVARVSRGSITSSIMS